MQIRLALRSIEDALAAPVDIDARLDDGRGLISDVCQILSRDEGCRFEVTGPASKKWPVDIRVDLAVFLEQLPQALTAIVERIASFEIDFYEQGIETCMQFALDGEVYRVQYVGLMGSGGDDCDTITRNELLGVLTECKNEFLQHALALPLTEAASRTLVRWFA